VCIAKGVLALSQSSSSFVGFTVEDLEHRSDRELLERTAREPQAFGVFYRRHVGAVLAFFRRRTGDSQLALDLTAETFARALEHAGGFRAMARPPGAWLYAIARNLLTDSYRRGQVADDARRRLALEPLIVTELGFERVEAAADAAGQLAAIDLNEALSEDQADAVRARVLEDQSYEQIAEQLRCSPQVARQHVSRGLRNLKRRWEKSA
jgi:RNA polymerase sigma factor (sigma-70 family)